MAQGVVMRKDLINVITRGDVGGIRKFYMKW
jgi:hypothetical protein